MEKTVFRLIIGFILFATVFLIINSGILIDMTTFKYNFIKNCINSGGYVNSCTCAYEALQRHYGNRRLIEIDNDYRDNFILPPEFKSIAINACNY